MDIKGYLDGLKEDFIEGWCFDTKQKLQEQVLLLYINGQYVGRTIANIYREGIKLKGLHPTGHCGFKFKIENYDIKDITRIDVRSEVGKYHLKNSPMVINTNRLKIFYMHIPKTAGSSLNSDISLSFPNITKKSHIEGDIKNQDFSNLHFKSFLSGHLTFPEITSIFSKDKWDFITLIRNPIDQLESHINWLIKITKEEKGSQFRKSHGNLIQKISFEIRNMNLHSLEGKIKFLEKTRNNHHYRNLFENSQTKYFVGTLDRFVNSDDLYKAIKTVESDFLLCGISEDYNGFMRELTKHFGFNYIEAKERKNINKKKQKLFTTEEDIDLINPLIKYDQILYDFVKIKWMDKKI